MPLDGRIGTFLKRAKEVARFLLIFALVLTAMWLVWKGFLFAMKDIHVEL